MLNSRTNLIAAAVAVAALAPTAAFAGGASSTPVLKSAPQLHAVDATHATLKFAAERLPRTAAGRIDAKITSTGLRIASLKVSGRHGSDTVYTAKASSAGAMQVGSKFTVRLRLGDSRSVTRFVKLYAAK
jgi:hypothetical protein